MGVLSKKNSMGQGPVARQSTDWTVRLEGQVGWMRALLCQAAHPHRSFRLASSSEETGAYQGSAKSLACLTTGLSTWHRERLLRRQVRSIIFFWNYIRSRADDIIQIYLFELNIYKTVHKGQTLVLWEKGQCVYVPLECKTITKMVISAGTATQIAKCLL